MKINKHFRSYLAGFFFEFDVLQMKVRTRILCANRAFKIYMETYAKIIQATADNIIRRMRFALWIPKATDTQSEYVILSAFTLQQLLQERGSLLPLTYIA
jgi:hypothetical protein